MVTQGLLVRLHAQSGKADELGQFLQSALPLVRGEPDTAAWFGVKFGHNDYGIFDVFADSSARTSHLTGHVPRELTKHALSLLGGVPHMDMLDVLAANFAERTTLVGLGVD